ncbi:1-acyl-sn-glycerol-3-phosphate acyltransferase [Flavobacterium tibetense]|uniref:Acyltransferase n=1 Tax=Flavobacterium tibetense TaxID=2233533 RepID=A0A365P018_9FLAO|nr:1-acyl-sn-glycerol-3-phosphate acyltransferase [Flavobacterium tibetense]RBA27856.1 acyltransferase [Flavobacterium tibetense]
MKQLLYKFIFFKVLGWKIVGSIDANVKKCVMIVVPHTSWYDFFLGVFTRGIVQLEMNFVGKKELFVFPLNYYFQWMGGTPLNRQKNENKVDAIASIFEKKDEFRLAIAPEGTRKKVTEWKTGFYYIALKANVPILPVAFDYGKKEVQLMPLFQPTGDIETDFKVLKSKYVGVVGKFPEKSFSDF